MTSIESGIETERAKDRVGKVRNLEIGAYPKAEIVLVILGLKPATELDLAPWNSDESDVEKALSEAGLVYEKKDGNDKDWVSYLIGSRRKDVELLSKLDPSRDHRLYGELMGFPQTAVEAFETGSLLDIENEPRNPDNVIQMRLSKDHWQEELKTLERWNTALKQFTPEIHQELKGIE
ncbi:MAG: hypothetical protein HQ488_01230 [Parcubacteria group bacterium]|nr:hypothetical protein [Parcubacteria group bacterium]